MNYFYKNIKNTTSDFESDNSYSESASQCKFSRVIKTITLVMMLLVFGFSNAATITSTATGGTWATAGTWVGGAVPLAGDNVIIATTGGNSVDVQANITQTGSVTINNGAVFASTTSATVTIGSLIVNSGGIVNMNRTFTVTGTSSIFGTINFASSSGTSRVMTFGGDVTLNSGAVWTEPSTGNGANNTYSFAGNFINNATTFNALGTGTHTFSGTSKTISGTTTISIPNIIISGSITNSAVLSVGTSLVINNGATLQMGTGASPSTITGAGTFTLSSGATLGITSTAGITTSGASGNIQNTGTRTYSTGANYIYNGNANQAAGNGLTQNTPASVQINNTGNTITLGAATTISGNLNVVAGILDLGTGLSHTSATLTLGGVSQTAGLTTYGGTASSATTKNATYFGSTATGIVTVGIACTGGTWLGTTSTDWNTASNWCNGSVPTAATNVTIPSGGNQPTISGAAVCNNITIGSGATLTIGATGILSVSGAITKTGTLTLSTGSTVNYAGGTQTVLDVAYSNLTISGSGTKTWTLASTRTIGGNFTIAAGTTLTIASGRGPTVTGTTSVSGTLSLGISTSRTSTFNGDIIINSGGTWTGTTASPFTIAGNLQNNGTFTGSSAANTGIYTFSGTGKTISGTGTINIPYATINGTITNNGTLTVSTALAGTGGLTQGTTGVLNIGGTATMTTPVFSAIGNTVNYTGSAQTAIVTTYSNLTLSGSGNKTFANNPTVNGVLSMEGTATLAITSGTLAYGTNATLQYNAGTNARTVSTTEWPATFSGTGGVIIKGTGIITLNAAKVLGTNTNVPLNITSGAKLTTGNFGLTFHGDFIINAGTFTAGSSPIVITGTTATQSIAGFTTTGTVSMTKTSGTATFTENVSGAGLTINGNGGTLNLGSGLNHTFTGTWTRTNGTLNGGSSIINFNNATAASGSGGTFIPNNSTVTFSLAGVQTGIPALTYNNISFLGSGNKTLDGAVTVNGKFTIGSSAYAILPDGTSSTAKVLTLVSTDQLGGSWGSTNSTLATNKNAAFGSITTGILNVSTDVRLVITGTATQTAGGTQNITITAKNPNGSTNTTYTGDKILTFSGANNSANGNAPTVKNKTGSAIVFGSPTLITFTNGVATVSGGNNGVLTLYNAEIATVSVSDGTLTSSGTDQLTVNVSPATLTLAFSTQPGGGNADAVWSVQPIVTWQDTYGNVKTGASNNVTLAIGTNPSSGTLSGTKTVAVNTSTGQAVFTGLSIDKAGANYTLSATSTSGASGSSSSFNIVNPSPVLSSISPGTVCAGGSDFTLTLSGSNFTSASVVKIDGTAKTTTFIDPNNLEATISGSDISSGGTPSVTVYNPTPGGGTSSAVTLNVSQIVINPTIVQPSCYADGSISLSPTGGTSPYSYDWADLSGTNNGKDRTGLQPGNYTVTVTDANGCATTSGTYTLTAATGCSGISVCKSDSASILSVSPDPNNTSYTWTVPQNAVIRSGAGTSSIKIDWRAVPVGGYTVSVVGNNACGTSSQSNISVYVQQPTALAYSDLACSGSNLNLYASGGETYSWTGPNNFSSQSANPVIYNATSTQNGSYSVVVTNSSGCSVTSTVSVTVNTPPTVASNVITSSTTGNSDGGITLTVSGGSIFSYRWSAKNSAFSATTKDISGIGSDNYTVVVTNETGCSTTKVFTISNNDGPAATATPTNISCNGGSDGVITLTNPTGGTSPYTYLWSGPGSFSSTSQSPTGLSAGNYTVVISDANGYEGVASATVTEPAAIQADGVVTNIDCYGSSTGSISQTVTGGVSTYTYAWTGPNSFTATTKDISSIPAGSYSVTITDHAGSGSCSLIKNYTISQPSAAISATPTITHVACNGGSNGQAVLTVSGGTAPYTYVWKNGSNTTIATTKDVSGLTAGTYTVVITDSKSCSLTLASGTAITITEPTALSISASKTNVTCYGSANGTISLMVSGGTSPYTYAWSNGATTKNLSGLAPGNYSVTVTDANGCSTSNSSSAVVIAEPTALSASAVATAATCKGNSNGSINLTVSGGTSPYTYLWSNSAATEDISSLGTGFYSVTVTDNNGCTATASATVTEPTSISIAAAVTNVDCNGSASGAINLTVSGGTSPYTYDWTDITGTNNPEDRTNLSSGTYSVTVTDSKGCNASGSYSITQPTAISLSASKTNVSCNSGSDGMILLSVSGGTPPYTYLWSNSETTKDVYNLAAGTYTVTVTDANQCTASLSGLNSVTLTAPAALTASTYSNNIVCLGATNGSISLTVGGGTSPYSYAWSTGETTKDISNLTAGTYNVTITDKMGCSVFKTVEITQPTTQIELYATKIDASSCGGATGSINLTVVNGTSPFTYSWIKSSTVVSTSEDPANLTAGTYTVTVTDANGCSKSLAVTIANAPTMSVEVTKFNRNCLSANGSAFAVVSGGVGPYTYLWSPGGATTNNIANLDAGTYSVTVTDANSCTATGSAVVGSPSCETPVATDKSFSTTYPTVISNTVATNTTDADNTLSQLNFVSKTDPTPEQGSISWDPSGNGSFVYTPAAGYFGTFSIDYIVTDPTGLTDTKKLTITVAGKADMSLTNLISNSTPNYGNQVTFTLTAKNNGPTGATGASVTDVLPAGYSYVSNTSPSTGAFNSTTGAWSIGDLNIGATATLTITATINATGAIANSASISANQTDPDTNNNTAVSTPMVKPTVVSQTTSNQTPDITGTASVDTDDVFTVTVNGVTYTNGDGKLSFNTTTGVWTLSIPAANKLSRGTYTVTAKTTYLSTNNITGTGTLIIGPAQTTADGLWTTDSNWNSNKKPNSNTAEAIVKHVIEIPVGNSIECKNVTIDSIAKLTNNGTFTINDSLVFNVSSNTQSSQFINKGTVTNNGKIVIRKRFLPEFGWYFMSFPFDVKSDQIYLAGTSTPARWGDLTDDLVDFYAAEYDGYQRANTQSMSTGVGLNWINVTDRAAGNMKLFKAKKGYIIAVDHDLVIDFTSVAGESALFSTSDETITTTKYASGSTLHQDWNLIGLPYASGFKLLDASNSKPYYTYNYSQKNYLTVMPGDDVTVDAFTSFFLQAFTPGVDVVSFSSLGRAMKIGAVQKNIFDEVNLTLSNKTYSDNTRIRLQEDATVGYDLGKDAVKMLSPVSTVPQLYSISNGISLSVNALPATVNSINMITKIGENGEYTLRLNNKDALLQNYSKVMLYDYSTQTTTDLLQTESYNYTATTGTSTRFNITLYGTTVTNVDTEDAKSPIQVQTNGNEISLSGLKDNADVRIYDVAGRTLARYHDVKNGVSIGIKIPGVYLVQIESQSKTYNTKIIIRQ